MVKAHQDSGIFSFSLLLSLFPYLPFFNLAHRKAVGGTNILKETYLEFSWATFDFMSLKIWAPHYVGLTKRGYLYVFSTIYDDISSAVVTIDLRTIDVRVTGDVSSLVIGISNPTVKFYLKYASLDEFSSWLRQVSDFGVNAASQTVPSKAAERLVSSDKRPANAVGGTGAVRNSRRQQPGGTGVANDEFSDMFGM